MVTFYTTLTLYIKSKFVPPPPGNSLVAPLSTITGGIPGMLHMYTIQGGWVDSVVFSLIISGL